MDKIRPFAKPYDISWARSDMLKNNGYKLIYLIQEVDGWPDSPIKVGIAKDIKRRISHLQVGNPRKLTLAGLLCFEDFDFIKPSEYSEVQKNTGKTISDIRYENNQLDSSKMLAGVEAKFHKELKQAGLYISGEWFSGGVGKVFSTIAPIIENLPENFIIKPYPEIVRHERLADREQEASFKRSA